MFLTPKNPKGHPEHCTELCAGPSSSQRVPVVWAAVNPRARRAPADGPGQASLAWFGDNGKGPSLCPIPGLRGERSVPKPRGPQPWDGSEDAGTTQTSTSHPGASAEGGIKPARGGRSPSVALGTRKSIYTFIIICRDQMRSEISKCSFVGSLSNCFSLSFYLFNKGNG